ncbi:MAG TPA: hypothetical protein VJ785_05490 [Anaerolineales bacterium]|nr:hypothetical protein [Anaerolineales bacterium]
MKPCFNSFLLALLFLTVTACANINPQMTTPSALPRGPEVHGVFEGITPCSPQTRPLPQIPAGSDCEQMIWNLVLYQDPETGSPTTYSLKSAYGLPRQNTNGLVGGGTPISMEGNWSITTGTKTDPEAVVYQIQGDPQTTVSFLKVSDDLLHILDEEKALRVGHGAWSYTLNRMDNQRLAQADEPPGSIPDPPTRPPQPPMPEGSSVFGVFEGRTPCHEQVIEFTQIEPFPGCMKVKWRLTLYQDEATGAPSSYLFMGTSTYREGSWTIVHGMEGDPDAVVYQLQLRDAQQPLSFLKVDENHLFLMDRAMNLLVGNELFSYTLSRTE